MIFVYKALEAWYGGLGQTLVIATCPLIVGPILLGLLSHAPKWTPRCRYLVHRLERLYEGLLSFVQRGTLFCGRAATGLQRGLLELSFLGPGWVRFWGRVGDMVESVSFPKWDERKVVRRGDVGWDRPVRLWKRIRLAPPVFWVVVAFVGEAL